MKLSDRRGEPLLIYLIDPIHNYIKGQDNWMVPLNVLTIASYTKHLFGAAIDIRCFKFPDQLLKAIDKRVPHILGASNYVWNFELSNLLLRYAKSKDHKVITVMGGPNITETIPAMTRMMQKSACDFYVSGLGEHPFAMIVKTILEGAMDCVEIFADAQVHSVWQLDPTSGEATCKPTGYAMESLDEIPSPYLTGMVDEFFNQGLLPMIETNRGCPYKCTYCVWGVGNKVRMFEVSRVIKELDYCRRHATGGLLMINDANFGLYKRDLEIARHIKTIHNEYGWPTSVVVNWGQVGSEDALTVAEALKGISILRQSSQSMNPEVLKNINRRNITLEQWKKITAFTRSQGVETFGELILMLPGETFESYLEGLRFLFDMDIDCINTNQLQMLDGARINSVQDREKYGIRTKWRLLENAYGVYRDEAAVEGVELVVETSTFPEECCLICRPLSWLIQSSWTMRWHDLLLRLMASFNVDPTDFLLKAVSSYASAPQTVRLIFENFLRDACGELFESKDALMAHYGRSDVMKRLQDGFFKKLNTHYSAEILCHADDFLVYYKGIALDLAMGYPDAPDDFEQMIGECARFLRNRMLDISDIEAIQSGRLPSKTVTFFYDVLTWSRDTKASCLTDMHMPDGITYTFTTSEQQARAITCHIDRFLGMSREYQLRKLLEPYYGIPQSYLMFAVAKA